MADINDRITGNTWIRRRFWEIAISARGLVIREMADGGCWGFVQRTGTWREGVERNVAGAFGPFHYFLVRETKQTAGRIVKILRGVRQARGSERVVI